MLGYLVELCWDVKMGCVGTSRLVVLGRHVGLCWDVSIGCVEMSRWDVSIGCVGMSRWDVSFGCVGTSRLAETGSLSAASTPEAQYQHMTDRDRRCQAGR